MDNQGTDQQILERYREMPEEIRDLFDMGIIDRAVTMVSQQYGLTEEQSILLGNQIALTVLLFLPKDDFDGRLVSALNIGPEKATGITTVIESEVFLLVDDLLEEANGRFLDRDVTSEEIPPVASPEPEAATTPTESSPKPQESTNVIEALRTMQSDANRIHGYGAYRRQAEQPKQNANGTRPLVSPPRYVDIDENEK